MMEWQEVDRPFVEGPVDEITPWKTAREGVLQAQSLLANRSRGNDGIILSILD